MVEHGVSFDSSVDTRVFAFFMPAIVPQLRSGLTKSAQSTSMAAPTQTMPSPSWGNGGALQIFSSSTRTDPTQEPLCLVNFQTELLAAL
jgi:hypothetical protein